VSEDKMSGQNENTVNNTIRSVDRAIDVLLCFSPQTPTLNMTQISEKTGIHKSTVHRLLATLEKRRFVRRDPNTGIYRLGVRLIQMAHLSLEGINIRRIALPYMQQLADEFRETIDLAVLDGSHVMFLDVIQSPQRVKLSSAPGQRLPAYATASGKAILAWLPEAEAIRVREDGKLNYQPNKQPSTEEFLADLGKTRAIGYSIDEEVLEVGINAVGAPIMGVDHQPIASIAIAGPAFRLGRDLLEQMGATLKSTTSEISNQILLAEQIHLIE
jgi:DNA-binding IclR family transcriptional regulator